MTKKAQNGDLISKKAAIDALASLRVPNVPINKMLLKALRKIDKLPPPYRKGDAE